MHVAAITGTAVSLLFASMVRMANAALPDMPALSTTVQAPQTVNNSMNRQDIMHLTGDTRIGAMLHHPAFAGFGRLLLPWDERSVDEAMPLRDIGRLLPYHSHVDPNTVVSALNRMIDEAGAGKPIFYPFYSSAQREADSELAQTGLFFLRGKPGAPFAVIAPGGGFQYVGSLHEGFPYAAEIARSGYNTFVIKYRVGSGGSKATADLAAALTYIFEHARTLSVDTRGYSLWGSSAGARMAAAIGTHGTARFGGADLPKPATVVMAYTGHRDAGPDQPPTFVVAGDHDGIAPPSVMQRRVDALKRMGTQVEYHVYPGLGHGFGVGAGTSAEGWISKATQFWANAIE